MTEPDADGNWPLCEKGWGHGMNYSPLTGRQTKAYGWHRCGAWDGIVSALNGNVPKAREAWDVMRSMAGTEGLYGYEMLPHADQ